MKLDKTALYINLGMLLLIGGYGISTAGLTGLGVATLAIALLNIPIALVALIAGKKTTSNTAWILLAVWLLIGFSICSSVGFGTH